MKRFSNLYKIFLVFVLTVSTFALIACGKDENANNNDPVDILLITDFVPLVTDLLLSLYGMVFQSMLKKMV